MIKNEDLLHPDVMFIVFRYKIFIIQCVVFDVITVKHWLSHLIFVNCRSEYELNRIYAAEDPNENGVADLAVARFQIIRSWFD